MPTYDPADLTARFRKASDEFLAYVEGLNESIWSATTEREGWPIGVVAHHVAVGAQFCSDLAVHVAEGGDISWTNDFIDAANATHADVFADVDREHAIDALRTQFPVALKKIEGLRGDQLDRDLGVTNDFGEGPVRFAGDVIDRMIIAHIEDHLQSIKEATQAIDEST
jgi:hypothetical protein